MKICSRAVNFLQVINAEGDVRLCSWNRDNIIGNLLESDISDILHGKKATKIRNALAAGDYSNCDVDNCPYLANDRMEEVLIDIDCIPEYPSELYLAYEGVCNYNCTCCTSYQHMEDTKKCDYSKNYDLLEEKIKEILPYVKTISANGRGELFTSKRILKLLQSWRPFTPVKDVKVILETNGSMFDEKHWKQIENLGQYHLTVAITVMSFDEKVYQHLSGTNLSIDKLEKNLKYVKKLRNEGVIDYLEMATVLQEENFREMPEFARRCIEEFSADSVRIRPIFPGGMYDRNIQWFMDVRNPQHPYYLQYKNIMQHPVFRNPRVLLWSGNVDSSLGEHPGIKAEAIQGGVEKIIYQPELIQKVLKINIKNDTKIYLYGLGILGSLLARLYRDNIHIEGIFDKFSKKKDWLGIPVYGLQEFSEKEGIIIVTVYREFENIKKELLSKGFMGQILDLYAILNIE